VPVRVYPTLGRSFSRTLDVCREEDLGCGFKWPLVSSVVPASSSRELAARLAGPGGSRLLAFLCWSGSVEEDISSSADHARSSLRCYWRKMIFRSRTCFFMDAKGRTNFFVTGSKWSLHAKKQWLIIVESVKGLD